MKNNSTKPKKEKSIALPATPPDFVAAFEARQILISQLEKNSDGFEFLGINGGDQLIVAPVEKIEEGQLGVWKEKNGIIHLAFHYENFGDITLYAENDNQIRFKKKDLTAQCVVVGIIKPLCFAEVIQ